MKAAAAAFLAVAAALTGAGPAGAEPHRYRIDPEHLAVGFSARHIGYADVLGLVLKGEGSFVFDEERQALAELTASFDAASLFTNHDGRDGHLRGPDFMDAAAHPTVRFTMTSAEATGERTGKVTGDLTLRGQTQPITLDVTWNRAAASPMDGSWRLGLSARTVIQRSRWGMTYAVAQGWVADEIPVTIELEAVREAKAP